MSLMKTLAKVAIGVALAKGASTMMKKGGQARGQTSDGGLFGGEHSPRERAQQQGTGLEDMMGSILGGGSSQANQRSAQQSGGGGGLGDLLEQLGGGGGRGDAATRGGGGLNDLLGGLAGGAAGGGLGGLLESLTGKAQAEKPGGSFGDMLNQTFERGEPPQQPTPDQEAAAGLLLRAMIQAAKSDGKIDAAEKKKLLDNLGDVSAAERDFVNNEIAAPIDINGLARQVPRGMEQQVYMMSVMAIDLDNQNEAKYLHQLATAMDIGQRDVNAVHAHLGAPPLYS